MSALSGFRIEEGSAELSQPTEEDAQSAEMARACVVVFVTYPDTKRRPRSAMRSHPLIDTTLSALLPTFCGRRHENSLKTRRTAAPQE